MVAPKVYRRIGNRGAGGICPPGNTIEAFVEGIKAGAQMLEVDVRATKDQVLLLSQSSVQHFYGKEVAYNERDFSEWEKYLADTGTMFVTLQEALEFIERRRCGILLDVKEPGLENAIARLLRLVSIEPERIMVALPSDNSRVVFRALNPHVPIAHKIESSSIGQVTDALIGDLKTEAVFWHPKAVTPERVEMLHNRKIVVYSCPANLAQDMRRLNDECAVDGIVTDVPDLLLSIYP